jgi:endonuclease YncB( thermonuclease family)
MPIVLRAVPAGWSRRTAPGRIGWGGCDRYATPVELMTAPHFPAALLAVLLGCVCCGGCGAGPPPSATARGHEETAIVDHVVDGDTLDVWLGGHEVRVRTLQIDAPESSTLRFGHVDRCGAPAKAYAEKLVHRGETVTLELAGSERHDEYGRLLALVHLGGADAITWQQRMARSGWAEVFIFDDNRTWLLKTLQADQAYARRHHLGVYALCGGEFHEAS